MKRAVQFADEGGLTVTLTLERVEDVGPAIDFLTDMAGAVWRELVIEDDKIKSYVEANWRSRNGAPAAALTEDGRPRKNKPRDWSAPPNGIDARVLKAVRDLGRVDKVAIADDLDQTTTMIAMSLGRLRKGGHLREFEA